MCTEEESRAWKAFWLTLTEEEKASLTETILRLDQTMGSPDPWTNLTE